MKVGCFQNIFPSGIHPLFRRKPDTWDSIYYGRNYNESGDVRSLRRYFLICAVIWGVGAVLSCCFTQYIAIIAFVVWLIAFCKDVHFDEEKAFEKYKKH